MASSFTKTQPDYLRWIPNGTFAADTKELVKTILDDVVAVQK